MTPTDEELVRRCLDGERDAFAVLAQRYERWVYARALAKIPNPVDAEDVVQDTFEKAYASLWQLRRPDRFVFWLSRIALGCAADWHRRHRETVTDVEAMLRDVPDPCVGHAAVERIEETRRVYADVWRMLTDDEREVFLMHEVGEFTIAETAEALILRPETVEKRLVRAKQKIRERYERLGKLEEVTELVRSYGLTVAAGTEFIGRMLKSAQPIPSQPPSPSPFRWFGYWTTGSAVVAGAVIGCDLGIVEVER